MPSFNLEPISVRTPTADNQFLGVSFRLPTKGRDPIAPATRLHLSVEDASVDQEVHLEPLTSRDVAVDDADSTLRHFRIAQADIPLFNRSPSGLPATVTIKLHAWQGERWLGTWGLGTISKASVSV